MSRIKEYTYITSVCKLFVSLKRNTKRSQDILWQAQCPHNFNLLCLDNFPAIGECCIPESAIWHQLHRIGMITTPVASLITVFAVAIETKAFTKVTNFSVDQLSGTSHVSFWWCCTFQNSSAKNVARRKSHCLVRTKRITFYALVILFSSRIQLNLLLFVCNILQSAVVHAAFGIVLLILAVGQIVAGFLQSRIKSTTKGWVRNVHGVCGIILFIFAGLWPRSRQTCPIAWNFLEIGTLEGLAFGISLSVQTFKKLICPQWIPWLSGSTSSDSNQIFMVFLSVYRGDYNPMMAELSKDTQKSLWSIRGPILPSVGFILNTKLTAVWWRAGIRLANLSETISFFFF